ncbi:signal transduction histidine kinase [Stella humosa]|uniref:histidine kinase n=1 Tax=Stella humosa TaxID=94 RepID=A0A3N1LH00_9PROT|nr:HAMP domain-containing sensor histidine kinase [Stella humosa]ROP90520.1 signal transduction histidine kinase [Stella humosa]BBK29585.1 ATPase [Stella humosa]
MLARLLRKPGRMGPVTGLSSRLLVMTVFFVMLVEVFVYAPSVARFRVDWLEQRVSAAQLTVIALEATPDASVTVELANRLLDQVGAHAIVVPPTATSVRRGIFRDMPPAMDVSLDLRDPGFFTLISDAFGTLIHGGERVLWVKANAPSLVGGRVDLLIDEAPLRRAMIAFSWRILGLSLLISFLTAALIFVTLRWMIVRPLREIARSMIRFKENPEDASRSEAPSARSDEIGLVRRELAAMEATVRQALRQRARLAALGEAVTRINHDLRNILTTVSLLSDRLSGSDDPDVRRVSPTLMAAIDRAVQLCQRTLDFAREGGPLLKRSRFALAALVEELKPILSAPNGREFTLENAVDPALEIEADRDLIFRVLSNLGHNAAAAGAARVTVTATVEGGQTMISVTDDGPGLPPKAIANLFQPFAGAGRSGGTGLGLAIARELMRAHGGDATLVRSDASGTVFRLRLPIAEGAAAPQ